MTEGCGSWHAARPRPAGVQHRRTPPCSSRTSSGNPAVVTSSCPPEGACTKWRRPVPSVERLTAMLMPATECPYPGAMIVSLPGETFKLLPNASTDGATSGVVPYVTASLGPPAQIARVCGGHTAPIGTVHTSVPGSETLIAADVMLRKLDSTSAAAATAAAEAAVAAAATAVEAAATATAAAARAALRL
eukprot:352598-Chlamydomonas_euryale.AAC.10